MSSTDGFSEEDMKILLPLFLASGRSYISALREGLMFLRNSRLEAETLKVLGTAEMKDKLYQAGFQVRPKGAMDVWARATKEITMFREIIDQAGIQKL